MTMEGMSMGGMSGVGGMDMTGEGFFTSANKAIARQYWYAVAVVVGLFTIRRTISIYQCRSRLRRHQQRTHTIPSKPADPLSQAYATATATFRELVYPQPVYFTGRISKYFTPLPIGHWLLLLAYWTMVLLMLWSNVILRSDDPMYAYKWEKVGFRAAWVTVAQIPFIYMLSMKFTPLAALTGISYERINWLHRWAARTVFLTAIVHWSFFLREWWLADFVMLEIEMMPMVRYGFGAFGTITWMVLSGSGFFRAMNYEVFVLQHIAAAAVLLWLLYCHVPSYARYNIYLAIGFVIFDWSARILWNILRNFHLLDRIRSSVPGYPACLKCLPGDVVRLTIEDAGFSWRAGQHIYLSIPAVRPFELHPFTISSSSQVGPQQKLELLIRAHKGFSRSLHKKASRYPNSDRVYRVLLSGPWGIPPRLQQYDTVVLIACATGAAFITPLVEDLIQMCGCVRKIRLYWIVRSEDHFVWFGERLGSLVGEARDCRIDLHISVHVTRPQGTILEVQESPRDSKAGAEEHQPMIAIEKRSETSASTQSVSSADDAKAPLTPDYDPKPSEAARLELLFGCRPSVEEMIRPPVEVALGETAVVVCGGRQVIAQARNFVAALSDERAVHKGTGAQGIFLFTETYGW